MASIHQCTAPHTSECPLHPDREDEFHLHDARRERCCRVGSLSNTPSVSVQTDRYFLLKHPEKLYKPVSVHTYRLWSHTGLLSQVLSLPRTPKQQKETHQSSCIHRKIKTQVLFSVQVLFSEYTYTLTPNTPHPMPHSSQQDSRSSAEISSEIFPPLWIHNLSDIASAAPKACWESKETGLKMWWLVQNALDLSFGSP